MKLKKLKLNAVSLEHSEMKQIKAGSSSNRRCVVNSPKNGCNSSNFWACDDEETGKTGECLFRSGYEVIPGLGMSYHASCYCFIS